MCIRDSFNAMKGHSRPCAVNVHGMREGEFELTAAKSDLNILVIGAGPGGMKAAATAAERGYRVSLYEKNTYMGGIMAAAGAPRFKACLLYTSLIAFSRPALPYSLRIRS